MFETLIHFIKGVGWFACLWLTLPALLLIWPHNKTIKSISDHTVQIIDTVSIYLGELIKWALPLLVLSVAVSVFALSIFGLSWTKLFESAQYLHAAVIMIGAAATLLMNQHVRVDIVQSRLSRPSKALVDFTGFYVGLMPVCLLLLWSSGSFIRFSWQIFEGSAEADGIRGLFLLKTLIPIFAIMLLAQGLAIALRAVAVMRGLEDPMRPAEVPDLFPHPKTQGQAET